MRIKINRNGGYASDGFSFAGGTLNVPVVLFRNPVESMEAATKSYVDAKYNSININSIKTGTIRDDLLASWTGDVTTAVGSRVTSINNSTTAGTFNIVNVKANGLVTSGSGLQLTDIPNLSWDKFAQGRPTSFAGYGITDGVSKNGDSLSGYLTLSGHPVSNNDISTKFHTDSLFPLKEEVLPKVGYIVKRATASTPSGFLKANGGNVEKAMYANLYAVIGDRFGTATIRGAGKPWKRQYDINTAGGTLGAWTTDTSLPGGLATSQAIVTKNRVYLLGGLAYGGRTSTVYTAPINGDGTLGAWTTATSLPGPLANSPAIVTKNRVYLLCGYGGAKGPIYISTSYTAPINEDGTLGAWTTTTNSLPVGLNDPQAIVTSSRVYLLGGYDGPNTRTSTVYTAPINEDGTIGAWTTAINSLPEGLASSRAIVTKNRVYLLGGVSMVSGWTSTIYTAPINEDGTLGAWTIDTNKLPQALCMFQAIVTSSRVYLLGGRYKASSYTRIVYTYPINEDGTLGAWTRVTDLPGDLADSQAIVTSSRVYLLGGHDGGGGGYLPTVYTATLSGGKNDYSEYYNQTQYGFIPVGKFRLPNLPPIGSAHNYIKY